MARRVKLRNLRVNGNRIPQAVWEEVAEAMLPGPAPTESERKHGKTKSALLKRICATDSEKRREAKKRASEIMSRAAKAEAAEKGWLQNEALRGPSGKSNEEMDRDQWDFYRFVAVYDLQTTGTCKCDTWPTAAGSIPLLTDSERSKALQIYRDRQAGKVVSSMTVGGQIYIETGKVSPGPEYKQSNTDWAAHWKEVYRLEAERAGS